MDRQRGSALGRGRQHETGETHEGNHQERKWQTIQVKRRKNPQKKQRTLENTMETENEKETNPSSRNYKKKIKRQLK